VLLSEPFFKSFTKRQVCDTSWQTEALIDLSCESRNEVDELVKKAIDVATVLAYRGVFQPQDAESAPPVFRILLRPELVEIRHA
jgi:predicted lactoylglutathione lyase